MVKTKPLCFPSLLPPSFSKAILLTLAVTWVLSLTLCQSTQAGFVKDVQLPLAGHL